jgi:hypothetical protein
MGFLFCFWATSLRELALVLANLTSFDRPTTTLRILLVLDFLSFDRLSLEDLSESKLLNFKSRSDFNLTMTDFPLVAEGSFCALEHLEADLPEDPGIWATLCP